MIRCPTCGSSGYDPQTIQCVPHRRAPVSREDPCDVDATTRDKVLLFTDRLKEYDITVNQKDGRLVLDFEDWILDDAVLRGVVLLLWDNDVPPDQIRRLRLDEPERVNAVIREGTISLRNGTGELTQEFRSHVLRWFQVEEGNMAVRLNALATLREEFEAFAVAASDKEISDETDQRVFEFLERYEDQQLPLPSQIPQAIRGAAGARPTIP